MTVIGDSGALEGMMIRQGSLLRWQAARVFHGEFFLTDEALYFIAYHEHGPRIGWVAMEREKIVSRNIRSTLIGVTIDEALSKSPYGVRLVPSEVKSVVRGLGPITITADDQKHTLGDTDKRTRKALKQWCKDHAVKHRGL